MLSNFCALTLFNLFTSFFTWILLHPCVQTQIQCHVFQESLPENINDMWFFPLLHLPCFWTFLMTLTSMCHSGQFSSSLLDGELLEGPMSDLPLRPLQCFRMALSTYSMRRWTLEAACLASIPALSLSSYMTLLKLLNFSHPPFLLQCGISIVR